MNWLSFYVTSVVTADLLIECSWRGVWARRARVPCGGVEDEADRRRLRDALLRLVAEDGPRGTVGAL